MPKQPCPSCGKMISWYDNIPILSYILLRAKCRECGEPISIGYPLVEALTAALAAGLYLQFGPTVQMVIYFAFCCGLIFGSRTLNNVSRRDFPRVREASIRA